tara:strand:- start:874 stop:1635 length:762 start_codon:yes stop_codon:yes gene_type:complete
MKVFAVLFRVGDNDGGHYTFDFLYGWHAVAICVREKSQSDRGFKQEVPSQICDRQLYFAQKEVNMLGNAGRFIDRQSMVWMRKLGVPTERVWEAVSTKEGLENWWIVTTVETDLRPGGIFNHHWKDIINNYKENEYIDFASLIFKGAGMRFELKPNRDGTVFSFLDNWREDATPEQTADVEPWCLVQPGGPGTPWSGVVGGWHDMIDALESYLTDKTFDYTYDDLCKFYVDYLTDYFRWLDLMPAKREAEKSS